MKLLTYLYCVFGFSTFLQIVYLVVPTHCNPLFNCVNLNKGIKAIEAGLVRRQHYKPLYINKEIGTSKENKRAREIVVLKLLARCHWSDWRKKEMTNFKNRVSIRLSVDRALDDIGANDTGGSGCRDVTIGVGMSPTDEDACARRRPLSPEIRLRVPAWGDLWWPSIS